MDFNKFFTLVEETGDLRLILKTCLQENVLRNQAAYLLATAKWETNHTFRPVEEAYWLSEGWRKRNLRYYPWHGRGYVQMTWRRNYLRAEQETGVAFTQDPKLAMVPKHAALLLVRGTMRGWWTGKRLATYVNINQSRFINARRCINGTDKAVKIAEIAKEYDKYLLSAGYGVESHGNVTPTPREDVPSTFTPQSKSASRKASKTFLATLIEVGAEALVAYLKGNRNGI